MLNYQRVTRAWNGILNHFFRHHPKKTTPNPMVFMDHFQKRMQPHEEIHGILCFQKYISDVYIYIILYYIISYHIILYIIVIQCLHVSWSNNVKPMVKPSTFFSLKVDMHHGHPRHNRAVELHCFNGHNHGNRNLNGNLNGIIMGFNRNLRHKMGFNGIFHRNLMGS